MDRLRPFWDFDDLDGSERRLREQLDRETSDSGRAEVLTQMARVEGLRDDFDACERLLEEAETLAGASEVAKVRIDLEPSIAVVRFWVAYSGKPEAFADRLPERTAAGNRALGALERHLERQQYLVGDWYSLADIALYGYTHVAPEGGFDLGPYPAVRSWLDRVASEPGHVPIEA